MTSRGLASRTGLVKNWKCGEEGPRIPLNKRGGGGVSGKGAERLFWAVRVLAKDEGYCISHSVHVCVPMLYFVVFYWQHGTHLQAL